MSARLPGATWLAGTLLALAGVAGFAAAWATGGAAWEVAWAPSLDLRLGLTVDGLAWLYGLLASGVGFVVFVYSRSYLPRHLEHHHEEPTPATEARFFALLALFLVSMVGLVVADDLVLLFVFWDLTAVTSYFLIGYDRHEREARRAALTALLVTGASAVALLVAIVVLYVEYGSFAVAEVVARAEPSPLVTGVAALVVLAALAKSAQVPFHFWLPRAMVAPTPVSAYLHSAAMVAAGVFLLTRLHPLIAKAPLVEDALVGVGAASIAVGAVLALAADEVKRVLAYSTVAQYGYVTLLLGIGGADAVYAASLYVLAHGISKAGLFLAAGAAVESAGENRLSRLGGVGRRRPLLAATTGVLAAGLAGLPLTLGFFKDEAFFGATWEASPLLGAVAVAGAAGTFLYMWRFWSRIFLGSPRDELERVPPALVFSPLALALVAVAGGIVPGPFDRLAHAAAGAVGAVSDVHVAYKAAATAENAMALVTYVSAIALALLLRPLERGARSVARTARQAGVERGFRAGLEGLNRLSRAVHRLESADLRTRVAAVLVPGGILVALGVAATPTEPSYAVGPIGWSDLPLAIVLGAAAAAAFASTMPRIHGALVLMLSASGVSLAAVYALFGAPDVALVAVLVELVLTLLFFGVLALMPGELLRRESELRPVRQRRWRDPLVGVLAGAAAFVVVWGTLSRPTARESVAHMHLELAAETGKGNAVTAILTDFRALDTLGEITVVAVALLGVASLLGGGTLWARRR